MNEDEYYDHLNIETLRSLNHTSNRKAWESLAVMVIATIMIAIPWTLEVFSYIGVAYLIIGTVMFTRNQSVYRRSAAAIQRKC